MFVDLIVTGALHFHASRTQWREPLHPAPVTATPAAAETPAHDWSGVAACESGGDWQANTGNSFYGGTQTTLSTWAAFGGLEFAPRPDLATEAQQIVVNERILRGQGPMAWPTCHVYLREAA